MFKLNDTGLFVFKPPFENDNTPNVNLTVIGISTITTMVSDGYNILDLLYLDKGLTREDYDKDYTDNITIINFLGRDGYKYDIPEKYIGSIPNTNVVPYSVKLLTVSLGLLPDELDLTPLRTVIAGNISDLVGVDFTADNIDIINTSTVNDVTVEQHGIYEEDRLSAVKSIETKQGKINRLENENEVLRRTVTELQNILLDANLIRIEDENV